MHDFITAGCLTGINRKIPLISSLYMSHLNTSLMKVKKMMQLLTIWNIELDIVTVQLGDIPPYFSSVC